MADNKFGLSDALINAVRQVAENNAPLPRDERERDLARQARSNPRSLDEGLSPGQELIARKRPPRHKIGANDLAALRGENMKENEELDEATPSNISTTRAANRGDKALDKKYGYGTTKGGISPIAQKRAKQGFGAVANYNSARAAQVAKSRGQNERGQADAVHRGWGSTVDRMPAPDAKKQAARKTLKNTAYSRLSKDEQEKDVVLARAVNAREQIEVGNTSDVYFYEKMQEAAKAAKYDPTKPTEPHVIKKHPEGGYVVVKVSPNNPHEHIKGARITSGQESIRNYTLDGRAYTETTNEETEHLDEAPMSKEQRDKRNAFRKSRLGSKGALKPKKAVAYVHPEPDDESKEPKRGHSAETEIQNDDDPNKNIIDQLRKLPFEGKHRITFKNGKTHLLSPAVVGKARTLHGNMHPSKKGDFQERLAASLESFQDALKNPENEAPKPKGREARLAPKPLDKNFMDDLARVSRGGPARER